MTSLEAIAVFLGSAYYGAVLGTAMLGPFLSWRRKGAPPWLEAVIAGAMVGAVMGPVQAVVYVWMP